jgi:WD40 repeat protein
VYDNLNYFNIAHQPIWMYKEASVVEGFKCKVFTQLQDGRVCGGTGDKDENISIYNMDTGTTEATLLGHSEIIHCIIQLEDGRLCSGSKDTTIRLWSIDSGENSLTINDAAVRWQNLQWVLGLHYKSMEPGYWSLRSNY